MCTVLPFQACKGSTNAQNSKGDQASRIASRTPGLGSRKDVIKPSAAMTVSWQAVRLLEMTLGLERMALVPRSLPWASRAMHWRK